MTGRVLGSIVRIAPGAVSGPGRTRGLTGLLRRDMANGGSRRIAGQVTSDGAPAARRVRIHDQPTGSLVAETWSDATGAYVVSYLRDGTYYAIALDHTGAFDPAAKADLVAEPMP